MLKLHDAPWLTRLYMYLHTALVVDGEAWGCLATRVLERMQEILCKCTVGNSLTVVAEAHARIRSYKPCALG